MFDNRRIDQKTKKLSISFRIKKNYMVGGVFEPLTLHLTARRSYQNNSRRLPFYPDIDSNEWLVSRRLPFCPDIWFLE